MAFTIEPPGGLAYHLIHRGGRRTGWAWTLLGVFGLALLGLVIGPSVVLAGFTVWYSARGADVSAAIDRLQDTHHVTPALLAYVNLSLAAAIPAAMVITWLVHGLRPRWLASVRPRIRWQWLATCLGIALVTLLVTVLVSSVLPSQGEETNVSTHANPFTTTTRDFLIVIALLTPLQAVGEEYAFRGYLTQAFGGLLRRRWAAVVIPALLFAFAHGAQDLPLFIDRFAFGLVAGTLVIATGGLEAGIAMHVLNNFLAFGLALAFGDISNALNATSATWWDLPVTLTQSLVFLGLTVWAARRRGLVTETSTGDRPADFVSDAGHL